MAHILILDDDFMLARRFRDALRARRHEVVLSLTSSEATAQIEHQVPNVMVIDLLVQMGRINRMDSGLRHLSHLSKLVGPDYARDRVIRLATMTPAPSGSRPRQRCNARGNTVARYRP